MFQGGLEEHGARIQAWWRQGVAWARVPVRRGHGRRFAQAWRACLLPAAAARKSACGVLALRSASHVGTLLGELSTHGDANQDCSMWCLWLQTVTAILEFDVLF